MDYNYVMMPHRPSPPLYTGANYYILENGEPKRVESQAEHEAWFKSHSEWLLGDFTVKGAKLQAFFHGVELIVAPDFAGLPGGSPALWEVHVEFPGARYPYSLGGSICLEDALCALGVALWWLKDSAPPIGDIQCQTVHALIVTAINAEADQRWANASKPRDPGLTPPPAPEPIIIPPDTPVIDASATQRAVDSFDKQTQEAIDQYIIATDAAKKSADDAPAEEK